MNRLNKTESDIFISWVISLLPKDLLFRIISLNFAEKDDCYPYIKDGVICNQFEKLPVQTNVLTEPGHNKNLQNPV